MKIDPARLAEVERRLRAGEPLAAITRATGVSQSRIWAHGYAVGLLTRKRMVSGDEAETERSERSRRDGARRRAEISQARRARAAAARERALAELQADVPGYTGVGHLLVGMHRVPEVPRRSA